MEKLTFITGNQHKADYLAKWLGVAIPHHKLDLEEIQSLDIHEVVEHKARQAYQILGTPVLVEDVSLTFTVMGHLPGTFIKWFLDELGTDGLCKLADSFSDRTAINSIVYALYDGEDICFFEALQLGRIALAPKGSLGFGWNAIFVPDGSDMTYAEMTDEELWPFSPRAQAIQKLKNYLTNN